MFSSTKLYGAPPAGTTCVPSGDTATSPRFEIAGAPSVADTTTVGGSVERSRRRMLPGDTPASNATRPFGSLGSVTRSRYEPMTPAYGVVEPSTIDTFTRFDVLVTTHSPPGATTTSQMPVSPVASVRVFVNVPVSISSIAPAAARTT